ncbi:YxiG family protein [Guggenheimella bovis]
MLQELLETIHTKDIKDVTLDLKHQTIELKLTDSETIRFEGVKSFFYTDEGSLSNEKLHPIIYDRQGFDASFERSPLGTCPNISLTVKDLSILLEAKQIRIRGELFLLQGVRN